MRGLKRRIPLRAIWGITGLLATGTLLIGCKKEAAQQAPPPPTVTVANPVERDVVEWDTYTGHLESPESVNVAARVSGLIMQTPFKEGTIVKKGDVLFVIDDRPFKADLGSKEADQERAEAQLAIAGLNLSRQDAALKANAVSQQDYDNAKATRDQADASVAGAKAAVSLAKLNLEWCNVTSPIDGRVSNKRVTVGNLINGGAGQATLLTTVQSVDPIYCYVDVDEHSVLKYQKLAAEGKRDNGQSGKVPCYLNLANETDFPHAGVIDFIDNHVDPNTGTLRARGVLKNKSGVLTPGFFASMKIPGSGRYHALLIPDVAIGNEQDQRTVFIINDKNLAESKPVQLGALFGSLRAIVSGISPNDRVVINGLMHVRPGAPVTPAVGEIKVDEAAFVDPSASTTQPSTEPAATEPSTESTPTTTETNGTTR